MSFACKYHRVRNKMIPRKFSNLQLEISHERSKRRTSSALKEVISQVAKKLRMNIEEGRIYPLFSWSFYIYFFIFKIFIHGLLQTNI